MSTSLISLFSEKSISRSNSLSQKTFICPPTLSKSLSQSKLSKKQNNQSSHKYVALCRALYLLQKKTNQLNYLFFCRLERISKAKQNKQTIQPQQTYQQKINKTNQSKILDQKYTQKLSQLIDCVNVLQSKYNFTFKLPLGFAKIAKTAKAKKLMQLMQKFKPKSLCELESEFFLKILNYTHMHLKFDFFVLGIQSIQKNYEKRVAFKQIQKVKSKKPQFSSLPTVHQQSLSFLEESILAKEHKQANQSRSHFTIIKNKTYFEKNKPKVEITVLKNNNRQKDQRNDRNTEHKTHIQQPRRMPIIGQALGKKTRLLQNDIISSNQWVKHNKQESISIIHKIQPEKKTYQVPDLNDQKAFSNHRQSFLDRIQEQIDIILSDRDRFKTNCATNRSQYNKLLSESNSLDSSIIQWTSYNMKQSNYSQQAVKRPLLQLYSIDQNWKSRSRLQKASEMIEQIDRIQQKNRVFAKKHIRNRLQTLFIPQVQQSKVPGSFKTPKKGHTRNKVNNKENLKRDYNNKKLQLTTLNQDCKKQQENILEQYFKQTHFDFDQHNKQEKMQSKKLL